MAFPVVANHAGTVLAIDDEPTVCKVIALTLGEVGLDVRTASSSEHALEMLSDRSFASRVKLVLLDVSMPGLSGPDTRARLHAIVPCARVVFLTGHAVDATAGETVLRKPLEREALVSTVLALLGCLGAEGFGGSPRMTL